MRAAQQARFHAAFVQIGDQHQNRVARLADQALAITDRAVDVGAAAELHAEQHLDGIVELFRHVDDGGVEHHHLGVHRRQARHHRAEDARIHDRVRHRAALVDAQHHLALRLARLAAVADQRLRNDGAVLGLPVAQVRADRAMPVDLGMLGAAVALAAIERAADGTAHRLFELAHEFIDHLLHHRARRGLGALRNHAGQRNQIRHQMHIGLHALQHFGLQHELAQVQPLHRIALPDLHDRAREITTDVAQPTRDVGRRIAETTTTRSAVLTLLLFVERGERLIDIANAAAQRAAACVRRLAQHQAPPLQAIGRRQVFELRSVRCRSGGVLVRIALCACHVLFTSLFKPGWASGPRACAARAAPAPRVRHRDHRPSLPQRWMPSALHASVHAPRASPVVGARHG